MRFVFIAEGEDPDTSVSKQGADAFVGELDRGLALSDYVIRELSAEVDLSTVDGKARFAELARPLLGKIAAGVYRDLLLQSLADTVGLPPDRLEKNLGAEPGKATPTGGRKPASLGRSRAQSGRPSVVRRAITLLLNHPEAGARLDVEKIAEIERPGIDLLEELIETVQDEPNIRTAGLLERWRHDEQGRHLGKLAATEVPSGGDFDAAAELSDCLEQIAAAGRRDRIDFLIEKQRLEALSDDELSELRQLS